MACLLFGSAAWKCAQRDAFIGWKPAARERKLQWMANNTRFLIPPWVVIPQRCNGISDHFCLGWFQVSVSNGAGVLCPSDECLRRVGVVDWWVKGGGFLPNGWNLAESVRQGREK